MGASEGNCAGWLLAGPGPGQGLALEFGALTEVSHWQPKGQPERPTGTAGITWVVFGAIIDPMVLEASVEKISQAHGASLCKRQMSPQ